MGASRRLLDALPAGSCGRYCKRAAVSVVQGDDAGSVGQGGCRALWALGCAMGAGPALAQGYMAGSRWPGQTSAACTLVSREPDRRPQVLGTGRVRPPTREAGLLLVEVAHYYQPLPSVMRGCRAT